MPLSLSPPLRRDVHDRDPGAPLLGHQGKTESHHATADDGHGQPLQGTLRLEHLGAMQPDGEGFRQCGDSWVEIVRNGNAVSLGNRDEVREPPGAVHAQRAGELAQLRPSSGAVLACAADHSGVDHDRPAGADDGSREFMAHDDGRMTQWRTLGITVDVGTAHA